MQSSAPWYIAWSGGSGQAGLVSIFHAALFILLPWSVKTKAILGLFLGLIYVALGVYALYAAMNEKTWMEKSGAAKMLKDVTGQANLD